jgi:thiamine transporter ThiT
MYQRRRQALRDIRRCLIWPSSSTIGLGLGAAILASIINIDHFPMPPILHYPTIFLLYTLPGAGLGIAQLFAFRNLAAARLRWVFATGAGFSITALAFATLTVGFLLTVTYACDGDAATCSSMAVDLGRWPILIASLVSAIVLATCQAAVLASNPRIRVLWGFAACAGYGIGLYAAASMLGLGYLPLPSLPPHTAAEWLSPLSAFEAGAVVALPGAAMTSILLSEIPERAGQPYGAII